MTEQTIKNAVVVGNFTIAPPLLWEEIKDGKEYAVIDTTDAGDWAIKFERINKSNRYYWVLAQAARIFANSLEASKFIEAIQSLGEKNEKTNQN